MAAKRHISTTTNFLNGDAPDELIVHMIVQASYTCKDERCLQASPLICLLMQTSHAMRGREVWQLLAQRLGLPKASELVAMQPRVARRLLRTKLSMIQTSERADKCLKYYADRNDRAAVHWLVNCNPTHQGAADALSRACMKNAVASIKEILKTFRYLRDSFDSRKRRMLITACIHGSTEAVAALLDANACADMLDKDHRPFHDDQKLTTLTCAIEFGHAPIVKLLLDAGVYLMFGNNDGTLHSPLVVACRHGNLEIVQLLIAAGCCVQDTDFTSSSLLHIAAEYGHVHIVYELIASGASVHAADRIGNTALTIAAMAGCLNSMTALVDAGANIHKVNMYGESPLDYAVQRNQVDITVYLEKHGLV